MRVPGASALDERTFGKKKVVAKMATALAELPELVFLNDDSIETVYGTGHRYRS